MENAIVLIISNVVLIHDESSQENKEKEGKVFTNTKE